MVAGTIVIQRLRVMVHQVVLVVRVPRVVLVVVDQSDLVLAQTTASWVVTPEAMAHLFR